MRGNVLFSEFHGDTKLAIVLWRVDWGGDAIGFL
jgi:hypothetical protein